MIIEQSWLWYMQQQRTMEMAEAKRSGTRTMSDVLVREGVPLPATVEVGAQTWVMMAVDVGNAAFKVATRHAQHARLVVRRIPAAYGVITTVRSAERSVTYRLDDSKPYRLYDVKDGSPLPSGFLHDRLHDARFLAVLYGSLVDTLVAAGYSPGDYHLFLGMGVPNEEVELGKPIPKTAAALDQLRGSDAAPDTREIVRVDERGVEARWTLTLARMLPSAQTLGTFAAWHFGLGMEAVNTRYRLVEIFDLGGGHQSYFKVEMLDRPDGSGTQTVGTGRILGTGVNGVAERIIEEVKHAHGGMNLSIAAAHQAILTGKTLLGGREADVLPLIHAELAETGEDLVARTAEAYGRRDTFVMNTGGGVVRLRAQLEATARDLGRAADDHLILPDEVTGIANVVGLYGITNYAARVQAQQRSGAGRPHAAARIVARNGRS